MRRNHQESLGPLLLARGTNLDRAIRQRMHNLSTKQEPHAPNEDPPVQNHGAERQPPVLPSGHGPNHGTPQEPRARQHTNHRRSWVLTGRPLPTLPEDDHGPPDCTPLLPAPVPMVRASPTTDIRPGPTFHLPLWASTGERIRDLLEFVDGVPPSNQWVGRAKEPVGGAIPPTLIHQSA